MNGQTVTVHITIYDDRTMSWRVVGMPTDDHIRMRLHQKGFGTAQQRKIAKKLSDAALTKIAEDKLRHEHRHIPSVKKMYRHPRSRGVEIEN